MVLPANIDALDAVKLLKVCYMGRENISKWQAANYYTSMADTLKIVKQLSDDEIRNGIDGVIKHCQDRAKELDKKR